MVRKIFGIFALLAALGFGVLSWMARSDATNSQERAAYNSNLLNAELRLPPAMHRQRTSSEWYEFFQSDYARLAEMSNSTNYLIARSDIRTISALEQTAENHSLASKKTAVIAVALLAVSVALLAIRRKSSEHSEKQPVTANAVS